ASSMRVRGPITTRVSAESSASSRPAAARFSATCTRPPITLPSFPTCTAGSQMMGIDLSLAVGEERQVGQAVLAELDQLAPVALADRHGDQPDVLPAARVRARRRAALAAGVLSHREYRRLGEH